MKRNCIKKGCLLLGLSLILTSCATVQDQEEPKPDQTAPAAEHTHGAETTAAPDAGLHYDDSLITLLLDEADEFVDNLGQDWQYSYQIPQLRSDSRDAKAINDELKELLTLTDEAQRSMEAGDPPLYGQIGWESHWNGSLLSLLVTRSYQFHSEVEYQVYNFDFESGKRLTGPELLAYVGVTEEDFFSGLRRAAAAEHDRENIFLFEQYPDCFDAAADLRAQTISARNLNWEEVLPYLDDGQVLTAVINRAVYAGGGVMRESLVPEIGERDQGAKSVKFDFVSAELEQDQVTITFHKTEESDWYIPAEGVDYDTAYPVEGLYGSYTDLAIGILGQNIAPHIFLLDDQGRVTFCNVMGCANASGPRFFAVGPLMGVEHVTSFEAVSSREGQTVLANTADGQQLDLAEYVIAAEGTMHPLLKPDCTWSTDDLAYTLNISEDFPNHAISWGGGGGVLASGTIFYGGMTEAGQHYPFFLWTEAGEHIGGVLTMTCETSYTAPEGGNELTITQYTGPLLAGLPESGTARLQRQW